MKGISLSSVIQVINLERQSCDIEAQSDGQTGQLHFREGTLVDAIADDLAGEAAAFEILRWQNPEFEVNTEDSPRDRIIETDLTELLLEVARREDEEKAELTDATSSGDDGGVASAAGSIDELEALVSLDSTSPGTTSAVEPAPPVLELATSETPAASDPPIVGATASTAGVGRSGSTGAGTPPSASPGATVSPLPVSAASPAGAGRVDPTGAPPPDAASAHGAGGAGVAGSLSAASLQRVVTIARDGLGDALISADVYSSADGTPLVGVNSQPAACALINQITERMTWALGKSGLPSLGRYYTAELADAKLLLVAPCGAIQLNLVVDTTRVQLGLLLNVILPEVLSALEAASPA